MKISKEVLSLLLSALMAFSFAACCSAAEDAKALREAQEVVRAQYGENKRISDGNYDKSLAVKCVNGTFVGRKNEGVIAYKGIPFVGKQPAGELRWKAPVDVVPDDGVYEAYYNGKTPVQGEGLYETASLYVQGEDCLYLNVWKADEASAGKKPVMVWIHGGAYEMGGTADPMYELHNFAKTGSPSLSAEDSPDGKAHEWPLYDLENKEVMVFDEFNIHPEKEFKRKILDWDRAYPLTKYYLY